MYNTFLEYLKTYNPEDVVSKKDVEIRKKFYPLLRMGMTATNLYKLHVVRKIETPKGVPIIYTPTHGWCNFC